MSVSDSGRSAPPEPGVRPGPGPGGAGADGATGGVGRDDPPGDGGLDLRPRTGPPTAGTRRPRRWLALVVLAVVVVAGVFVVRSLGSATVFFLNADEAMAQRSDLGTQRFRLQGTVVPGSVTRTADGVSFKVVYRGVEVPVNHVGDPPELFQPNIPVVLEGRWNDSQSAFASDRIMVKHSEEYDAKNPDRLTDAENQGGPKP